MSMISSGIVNSDEGGLHLNVNSDESKTSLLLYIAPPPFRPDTPQIPVSRSLGLYRRKSNRRIITAVPTPIKHRHSREQSSAQRQQRGWSGSHSPLVSGFTFLLGQLAPLSGRWTYVRGVRRKRLYRNRRGG